MLAVIQSKANALHDLGVGHPDQQARIDAINNQLIASGLDYIARNYDAPRAKRDHILLVHTDAYVAGVMSAMPVEGRCAIDPDTVASEGTLEAAERAAGAAVLGVDLLLSAEARPVFCVTRPPGHHAEPDKAMGFCFFNSAAIAAKYAIEVCGLERVAIIDFDAHHGNGTEIAVRGDNRILFCSLFQHPFYPHCGNSAPTPFYRPVPLSAGLAMADVRKSIRDAWFDRLEEFAPELVIFSAGFDAHVLDDMSGLRFQENDYAWLTKSIRDATEACAKGRCLSVLEGGYEPAACARSAIAHLKTLLD